ncbi:MAG: helix-turn-helix transcriptional regulator [Candidatus Omnitrophota bacterium]
MAKGLSQESLALRAGIPRPNLSAIEHGRQDITVATLRALSFALGIKPGVLVDGIAPLELNKSASWPRKVLENTVQVSLGAAFYKLNPKDRTIGSLFSKITKNRINAQKKIYKNTIKTRKACINSWLMLKSRIGKEVADNLLSRQDKLLNLKINE